VMLYVYAFLINFGWGMVIPLFPLILQYAGGSVFHFTFSFFLFNFISASLRYPIGYIADTKSRKYLLLWCAFIGALSSIIAYSCILPLLLVAFGLLGLSSAFYYQTFYAFVVDKIEKRNIGRVYGNMHIVEGIGTILGPLISGFLLEIQPKLIFIFTFTLLLSSILPLKLLREPVNRGGSESFSHSLKLVFSIGAPLFVAEILRGFTVGFITPSLPVYLKNDFFAHPSLVGILTTIMTISTYSAQTVGALVDRFGSGKIFIASSLIAFPFLFSFSFINSLPLLSLVAIVYFFFSGISWLSFSSLLAIRAPDDKRALFLGSAWSMWRFGYAFGSISSAFFWTNFGIRSLFPISALFSLFAAILVLLFFQSR
ncbi:MAG: MFS transporter, partial [Candidatus Methanospirareceae archaeon]